jgi:hypothetical protein
VFSPPGHVPATWASYSGDGNACLTCSSIRSPPSSISNTRAAFIGAGVSHPKWLGLACPGTFLTTTGGKLDRMLP